MLLVASETGHVYTFATRKLQPMITSEAGKALIQTCLNSPDIPASPQELNHDQRMCATGFEETELSYNIGDDENSKVSWCYFKKKKKTVHGLSFKVEILSNKKYCISIYIFNMGSYNI